MTSETSCILWRSNRKRGRVQHLHVQTRFYFENPWVNYIRPVFSHTRTTKAANSKAFTCKMCDNTTHSKGLITWAREAMHMNSLLPAVLFLSRFIRRAARQAWLLRKFPPGIPASQYWDPSKPGWLGCHIIAKLIFVAFNKGAGICAKQASLAHVIRSIVL